MCWNLTSITKRSLISNWCPFTAVKIASGASKVGDNYRSPIRSLCLLSLTHLVDLDLGFPLPSFSLLSSVFWSFWLQPHQFSCAPVHVHMRGHGLPWELWGVLRNSVLVFQPCFSREVGFWKIWLCSCSSLVQCSARETGRITACLQCFLQHNCSSES